MNNEREQYTMGYGPAATAIMSMRTAQSHAGFFTQHLKPGMTVLDCGCGPGTITIGFAETVAPSEVVGTEIEEAHVTLARENAARQNTSNVRFQTADLYQLPFADESFDAVFISAVLANLKEPIRGVGEAYRVLKRGGVIGVKDFDHGGDLIHPKGAALEKYNELYVRLRRSNGHDPESGRKIGALLSEAGFVDVEMSALYESFIGDRAKGFAEVSIGLLHEAWGKEFESRGWTKPADIQAMIDDWTTFANTPGAIFAACWCEAIAHKNS